MNIRPRRNRRSLVIRDMLQENRLHTSQLVYPVFFHEEKKDVALASMPRQTRWSCDGLLRQIETCIVSGLNSFALFPKIPDNLKSRNGLACTSPDDIVPCMIARIKERFPEVCLFTDVALDPYSSDGHDGIVSNTGEILNDETVALLTQQAVVQAQAGTDFVAPSDMMDGRVAEIRKALDAAGYATQTSIMSYCAKYASAFYGPFRGALDSAPKIAKNRPVPMDKKTYQMNPSNSKEALMEATLDMQEGADMLMVKPAGLYLDIIQKLSDHTPLPVSAYQVSGEYASLYYASQAGAIDYKQSVLESVSSIHRAGANVIFSYFAPEIAKWLHEERA